MFGCGVFSGEVCVSKVKLTFKFLIWFGLFIFSLYLVKGSLLFWIIGAFIKVWSDDNNRAKHEKFYKDQKFKSSFEWQEVAIIATVITIFLWIFGVRNFILF